MMSKNKAVVLTQERIDAKCNELANFLIKKNESYGNSVFDPINIFSNASPSDGIRARIDDKLNRIANESSYTGDNDIKDLTGYLLLLAIEEDISFDD